MSQHNHVTVVTSKIDLEAVLLLQDKPCYAEVLPYKNCGSMTALFIFSTQGVKFTVRNIFLLINNMSQENKQ
jgi:hypothetical protein